MSYEMLELFRHMDFNDTETQLALQCAPLLTGLKLSNLFIISLANEQNFLEYLDRAKKELDEIEFADDHLEKLKKKLKKAEKTGERCVPRSFWYVR